MKDDGTDISSYQQKAFNCVVCQNTFPLNEKTLNIHSVEAICIHCMDIYKKVRFEFND